MPIKGPRHRKLSPHSVRVVTLTIQNTGTMNPKRVWTDTDVVLPCRLIPLATSEQTAFLSVNTRATFRVRFADAPNLDSAENRLRVVTPAHLAGKMLRLQGPPIDAHEADRSWQVIAVLYSEDNV